jgi:hypothetical protein
MVRAWLTRLWGFSVYTSRASNARTSNLLLRREFLTLLASLGLTPPLSGCLAVLARLFLRAPLARIASQGMAPSASYATRLGAVGRPAAIAHSARLYPALRDGNALSVLSRSRTPATADRLIGAVHRDGDLLLVRNASAKDVLASRRHGWNVLHRERISGTEVGISRYNNRWDEVDHRGPDSGRLIGYDRILETTVEHYDAKSSLILKSRIEENPTQEAAEVITSTESDFEAGIAGINQDPAICDPKVRALDDKFRQAQAECFKNPGSAACDLQKIYFDNYQEARRLAQPCS